MGSPKEPQRLQLSTPDGASENTALRSPISSRIWQAEDPTLNSGEDRCMRNFCVSVQGDHEFPEGGFSFDTDNVLGTHRDFSLDIEGKEDQALLRQDDSSQSDYKESEILLQSSTITSLPGIIETADKEVCKLENIIDCKGESINIPSMVQVSTVMVSSTQNLEGVASQDISLLSSITEGVKESNKVANGELGGKTCISDPALSNLQTSAQEKQYRSIAISPIVPPEGQSSFSFSSWASEISSAKRTDEKDMGKNKDLPKNISFELTPPDGDIETKRYISVAVSPIVLPGDSSSSFTFQAECDTQPQGDTQISATNLKTDAGDTNNLQKKCSPEMLHHSAGVETKVEYKSVAVSPIIPPEGSSFTFQPLRTVAGNTPGDHLGPKTCSIELTAPSQDVGTQAKAECVSVAVSPIIPPDGSSSFTFQSEHQRGAKITEDQARCTNTAHNENVCTQADTSKTFVSVAISPIVLPSHSSSFTFLSEKAAISSGADHSTHREIQNTDTLPKTCSFEITPPEEETESGATSKIEYRSIAVSPIIPPHDVSFTFQHKNDSLTSKDIQSKNDLCCADEPSKTHSLTISPFNQKDNTQAGNKAECVSVAVSPFVFSEPSSLFTFQAEQIQQGQAQKQDSSRPPETLMGAKPQCHSVGVQVDCIVQCASIAISPMPMDGAGSFLFHTDGVNQASSMCSHSVEKPEMKDAEMQVSIPVETRSIATDPMTPREKSPRPSQPEIQVKETKPSHPEPVREVSWDEKGMTWEVYGASMEVEVLGMAIQKHLEKQIEEHGKREKVMTPQNTRGSSIKATTGKAEPKRQPGAFSNFLRRRPRCCSRARPAVD
ncbi:G protein-regulated inducer of neurite outgrowth 1 [Gastrophryne carolinensis]